LKERRRSLPPACRSATTLGEKHFLDLPMRALYAEKDLGFRFLGVADLIDLKLVSK
jgi:hypothetical protein